MPSLARKPVHTAVQNLQLAGRERNRRPLFSGICRFIDMFAFAWSNIVMKWRKQRTKTRPPPTKSSEFRRWFRRGDSVRYNVVSMLAELFVFVLTRSRRRTRVKYRRRRRCKLLGNKIEEGRSSRLIKEFHVCARGIQFVNRYWNERFKFRFHGIWIFLYRKIL